MLPDIPPMGRGSGQNSPLALSKRHPLLIAIECANQRMKLLLMFASVLLAASFAESVDAFTLKKTDGSFYRLQSSDVRATAIVFVSAVCPMSVQYSERLTKLASDFSNKSVRFLIVNSNINETDEEVETQRVAARMNLPIYREPTGTLAGKLGAVATPTAVVVDQGGVKQYIGMIDNSRDPSRVTKELLRTALDAVLAGRPVETSRTRVIGCTIKAVERP